MTDIQELTTHKEAGRACLRQHLRLRVHHQESDRDPEQPRNLRRELDEWPAQRTAECLRLLRPFLDPEGVFLQIGTGASHMARTVAEQVRFAYCMDPSTPIFGGDDEEAPSNFERLHADHAMIPLGDDRVSVVFSDMLVGQLSPVEFARHCREVSRVLVPGGVYVCRTSHRYTGTQKSPEHRDRAGGRARQSEHTFGELAASFHAVGFTAVGVRPQIGGWSIPFPAWGMRAVEAILGRLPAQVCRWFSRSALFRPLFGTVTAVAWKDPRAFVHSDLSVGLSVGLL